MKKFYFSLIIFAFAQKVISVDPISTTSFPVYKSEETASSNYVPHKIYSDVYGTYPGFDGYQSYQPSRGPLALSPPTALQTGLTLLYKVGFYVLEGFGLFLLGTVFLTAICSLTSFCTISFSPLAEFDKDTMMRAFMSPEKIATAAALVQDAVGKYQRLQKMKGE